VTQPVPIESYVAVAPNQTMPGAQPIRQILTLEWNESLGVFTLVNNEVVAAMDPATGLTVRLATSEQMDDLIKLTRANHRVLIAILNELSGRESTMDEDDLLHSPEDGG
jgi:hypothetical protein